MATAQPPASSDLLGDGQAPTLQARDALKQPAIALIVVGALGVLAALYFLSSVHREGAPVLAALGDSGDLPPSAFWASGAWWLATALLCIAGGVQMLRLRTRWLAVAAAIVAMVPCLGTYPGCCVVGLPAGVWALVVLMQPQIKASFT